MSLMVGSLFNVDLLNVCVWDVNFSRISFLNYFYCRPVCFHDLWTQIFQACHLSFLVDTRFFKDWFALPDLVSVSVFL